MAETLLVVGLGASLLGTGISTIAGIQQAKFQAQIAKRSAEISRLNAERAVERSQIEAQDQDRLAAAVIGDVISNEQAGSGLSLRSGSFTKKRASLRQLARLDTLRIRQAGDIEAFNFLQEAATGRAEAKAFKRKAKFTAIAGVLKGISTIGGSSLVSGAATSGG